MWERGYCQPVPTMYDTHNSINYSNHSLKRGQPRIKQFTILFDALSSLSNKRAPLEIQAQTKSIKKLELCSRPSSSCNYVPTKKEKLHYHTLTHTHTKIADMNRYSAPNSCFHGPLMFMLLKQNIWITKNAYGYMKAV